jgi:hypothetical protein
MSTGKATGASHGSGLPVAEPERSLRQQRDELLVHVDELEGALRFMGTAHPRRDAMLAELEQARRILGALEAEIRRQGDT